jgi:enoyl-CoA hydratase/carnithine racemase
MASVESQRRGDAVWLTISSPPRNLLTPELMRGLAEALRQADGDEEVKAIVLAGAGDVFCGGLDVEAISAGANPVDFARELVALLKVVPALGTPVIAAVNGDALASGYSLVAAADVAIAVEGSSIGTYEASIGIWPMIAQVPPLKRLLPRHALYNLLTGIPFTAERALEIGAVNAVVPADRLVEAVEAEIPLVTRAGAALAAGRRAFYEFVDLPYDEALDEALRRFARMFE